MIRRFTVFIFACAVASVGAFLSLHDASAQSAVSTPAAQTTEAPASSPQVTSAASDTSTVRDAAAAAKVTASKGRTVTLPIEKANPVRIPRFETAPVIDGNLDEELWKRAAILRDFYQTQPGDNIAPSKPTEVYIRRGGRDVQVRHRVTLKLPRQISLEVSGVNGRVGVGEVDGPVRVSGVNGAVEVAQARGYSELSGINGKVALTIRQLGEQGIKASGINGSVELRFMDDVNADLNVSGINGSVTPDLPNVTIEGEVRRSNFRARIGSGGSPIRISGINGQIRLSRAS